jgi:hypothetical protein
MYKSPCKACVEAGILYIASAALRGSGLLAQTLKRSRHFKDTKIFEMKHFFRYLAKPML